MMKLALTGIHIPALLPSLAADLFFSVRQECQVWILEKNPAMAKLLADYLRAVIDKSGVRAKAFAAANEKTVLEGASAVIYADELQPGSRFEMDREALQGPREDKDNPGLTDQLRLSGGLEGLMRALRAGEPLFALTDQMQSACPNAFIINLAEPLSRTTLMFHHAGFQVIGLGGAPLRGPQGMEGLAHALHGSKASLEIEAAGLNRFSWLTRAADRTTGADLTPKVRALVKSGRFGDALTRRWMDWYGAVALGDPLRHGEFLPAQPDFAPIAQPDFAEGVAARKERILQMNAVAEKGADSREGAMAQIALLSKAPAERPVQCALAILNKTDLFLPAATRVNHGALPQLPAEAMVEAPLRLIKGAPAPLSIRLPGSVAEVCRQVSQSDLLAAKAAAGDRQALREYIETDIALSGLDRLYLMDVTHRLIRLNGDVLTRL